VGAIEATPVSCSELDDTAYVLSLEHPMSQSAKGGAGASVPCTQPGLQSQPSRDAGSKVEGA
jgi:hypothetical protein